MYISGLNLPLLNFFTHPPQLSLSLSLSISTYYYSLLMMIYLWGIRRPGRFPPILPLFNWLQLIFLIRPAIYIWIIFFFVLL
jgi:hypothetical protein